jgi:hypothetical protein
VTTDAVNCMYIVVISPASYLRDCLVNKVIGTPSLSVLDLRLLKTTLYKEVNASQSLALHDIFTILIYLIKGF